MLQLTERLEGRYQADGSVSLPFDERKRGRLKTTTEQGVAVGIFIERGEVIRDGTCLRAETGEVIQIRAAHEQVTTARCDDSHLFAKACYHLGNRHVPLQVGEGWLRYQHDHVLDDMLVQLGLEVTHESAPFEPESGAYSKGGHSHHAHGHHHHEH
ncbi:urease accessory protein UreE [Sansalvadorimonas verongulae]|uniref:urease accessory protein UreE n=1 Tax=Sansalvadorimonas verongulae TaxID=2172824 RepID=UPI0012BB541A|nr:urease accessory protein UreE [Sansalvadorimonas verongulae]MTI14529.1 urease accessory protein UreE [Sansalvadorimonas verongulae]